MTSTYANQNCHGKWANNSGHGSSFILNQFPAPET